MKMMHPHKRAFLPLLGSTAWIQFTPMDGLRVQPLNYVHNWTSPDNHKKKEDRT